MDGAVALARWLGDDLHAGIEYFFAGEQQARLTTAEELRKEPPKMAVHRIESILQQGACLAVDAADGVFERIDRFGQIGSLSVEISLAFLRRLQFVQRREIHRSQRRNGSLQALDLAR